MLPQSLRTASQRLPKALQSIPKASQASPKPPQSRPTATLAPNGISLGEILTEWHLNQTCQNKIFHLAHSTHLEIHFFLAKKMLKNLLNEFCVSIPDLMIFSTVLPL